MLIEKDLEKGKKWINIDSDKVENQHAIYQNYGIDDEIIAYARDKNERAHMDYDDETDTAVFIYNVLDLGKEKAYYETVPMTFIVKGDCLITISNRENNYIVKEMLDYLDNHLLPSIYQFLFLVLKMITDAYYPTIEDLDRRKDSINRSLRQRTTKKDLLLLSDVEISMVYLSAAAKQNDMFLTYVKQHNLYRYLTTVEKEQFEDIRIEAGQLLAMTELISQVLSQLSSSYDIILNNTLNDNLTNLTIYSVLLAVLSLITGFFGMNVTLPLTSTKLAWVYITIAGLVLWLVLAQLLRAIVRRR